ncbi:MAG: Ig-like domain-containing protein [Oscillospiraceae bacterium]
MKHPTPRRRVAVLALAVALVLAMSLPVSASVLGSDTFEPAAVAAFSKNGTVSNVITFSTEDFRVTGDEQVTLDSVILNSLPSSEAGMLMMGDQPLASGDVIALSALDGLRFHPLSSPTVASTSFEFTPVFSSGSAGEPVDVNLYLLTAENNPPVAENLEFSTYKNVAYTGQFSAVDPEGDLLTFQLVDKPARGSVTLSEDGSVQFVYTPYENKTGKDSFTYVAVDAVGNVSAEATVKIKIEKPSTKVTYADMDGHPAYNAAIRLAEEGIYVGANMDGAYFFQPDSSVTRSEFLALAMATVGMDTLEGVTTTGFYDDEVIATWAKPYVSSALKSGAVQGTVSEGGQVVFRGENTISAAEAAVLLDRLLSVTDVPIETWAGSTASVPTWASQAAVNLETVGVLQTDSTGALTLSDTLTRADAVQMLASALDVLEARESSDSWFSW